MSKQDASMIVKGYADLLGSMVGAGVEPSDESLYAVYKGLLGVSDGLNEESADCAPLTPHRIASAESDD